MSRSPEHNLYLASRSPRRAELLRQLGVSFQVIDVVVDETPGSDESTETYVSRIADAKAAAGHGQIAGDGVVLAADTAVSIDGRIFGKPHNHSHAVEMLRILSGRWHDVCTGVAVLNADLSPHQVVVSARVEFVTLDEGTIDAYWRTGEPADKAGAYGIQGLGGTLVTRIEGSYSAVVGLPLHETRVLLESVGVSHALRKI